MFRRHHDTILKVKWVSVTDFALRMVSWWQRSIGFIANIRLFMFQKLMFVHDLKCWRPASSEFVRFTGWQKALLS